MIKLFCLLITICSAVQLWAHPGIGIVMDSKGNLYYTDLKQVLRIDNQGRKTIVVPNVHTHELFLDKEDNLFGEHLWYNGEALDTWGHYVWKRAANGTIEKIIPDTEGFLSNYSFVRDHAGNMFYAERSHACQKMVRKNAGNQSITLMGDQCFHNIRNMAATEEGNVYIMDLFDLKKMDARGHVTTIAANLQENDGSTFASSQPNNPHLIMGITVDDQENIYATISGGRQIKKITRNGVVSIAATIAEPWAPSGILVSPAGDLYILEYKTANTFEARVEKVSSTGKRKVY
jgi:DNA-binding beta-propeller fold protein YncE